MSTFKFNGKVDDQIDEFKKFVEGLKDVSKVKILYEMHEETLMQEMQDTIGKINNILPEDIELDFNYIVNEKLKENAITIDFE